MSSFSLLILVHSFLLNYRSLSNNIGQLLLLFLEFYGRTSKYTSDINEATHFSPFYIYRNESVIFPVITDPFTGMNVGKRSFRIEDVRNSFIDAYEILQSCSGNGKYYTNDNYIYRLLLIFNNINIFGNKKQNAIEDKKEYNKMTKISEII